MGKPPLKVREGKKTCKGKPANGRRKGLRCNPRSSRKCLLFILRMKSWRVPGRARCCFFSTPRNGVKHKRRLARARSSRGRLRHVKIRLRTEGDTEGDRNISENLPDQEQEPGGASDGDDAGGPASPSTSGPSERPHAPTTRHTGKTSESRRGAEMAVDQEPWSNPACAREQRTLRDTEQGTSGETGGRPSPRPVSESPPEAPLPPDSQREPAVSNKALVSTIKEFLSGFYKVYGSSIPLQRSDVPQSLRMADMDAQKRDLAISIMTKYNSTLLRTSPPFSLVYRKHRLTLEDLSTLAQHNWLNDQVINMYGELIMKSTRNKVHFLNSFFHHQLETKGYEGVKRWTKQVSLFSRTLLLFPVHLEVHWCLVAVDLLQRSVRLYDSSEYTVPPEVSLGIQKYLIREAKERSLTCFQTGWVVSTNKKTPQQTNENDCGVFVLENCKRLAFRKPLSFGQEEIPSIRMRIYRELCERKLHL